MSTVNNTQMNVQSGLPAYIEPPKIVAQPPQPQVDTESWFKMENGSIYVKYISYNVDKDMLHRTFSFMGMINRIDVVNSPPTNTGTCYRYAFIHYDYWYETEPSIRCREDIISRFPMELHFWSDICYANLSVTINTRPVPKTTYNIDQLSDMYHRLREEFTVTIGKQASEITALRDEIEQLRFSQTIEIQDQVYKALGEERDLTAREAFYQEYHSDL
jgi:hypothetical protein